LLTSQWLGPPANLSKTPLLNEVARQSFASHVQALSLYLAGWNENPIDAYWGAAAFIFAIRPSDLAIIDYQESLGQTIGSNDSAN